jgi:hypothetical protein
MRAGDNLMVRDCSASPPPGLHRAVWVALALGLSGVGFARQPPVDQDLFEGRADVGTVNLPGSAAFDPDRKEWRLTASGENVWGKEDAFYFAWRKVSSDLTLTADVGFVGAGKNPHRKAGWMVRQGLDADVALGVTGEPALVRWPQALPCQLQRAVPAGGSGSGSNNSRAWSSRARKSSASS